MDIDTFLEQDIQAFLDRVLEQIPGKQRPDVEPTAYVTRDYEEEFFRAIDAGNVTQAKRVLHDLKAKFDEAPSATPEKEQLRALLVTLYDRFKDHIDAGQNFEQLEKALTGPEQSVPAKPEASPLVKHARDLLQQSEQRAASGEFLEAIQLYRQARKDALGMEQVPNDLAGEFMRAFALLRGAIRESTRAAERKMVLDRITEAERLLGAGDLSGARAAHAAAQEAARGREEFNEHLESLLMRIERASTGPPAEHSVVLDRQLLLQLERQKAALDDQLHRHDLAGGMRTYRDMRLVAQQITDAKLAEEIAQKLVKIYQILARFQAHADERGLIRKVP